MTVIADLLRDKWAILLHSDRHADSDLEIPTVTLDTVVLNGHLRVSLDEHGNSKLLIPVNMTERMPEDIETHGVKVGFEKYLNKGKLLKYAVLTCNDQSLVDVFYELAADIVRRIEEGVSAVSAVSQAIREFRRLVLRGGLKADRQTAIGLIGELLWLKTLLERNPAVTRSWHGPNKARHDFYKDNTALEIKTSSRETSTDIRIHGIHQLDSPEGGALYLIHYTIIENLNGDLTVPGLVDDVIKISSDNEYIVQCLEAEGYDFNNAAEWEQYRFSEYGRHVYEVKKGFPRLVPSDLVDAVLSPGISELEYKLDLAAAREFELKEDAVESIISGFVE